MMTAKDAKKDACAPVPHQANFATALSGRWIILGEKIYEYVVHLTGSTEYGLSLADVMAGKATPPPHGARFDGSSAGPIEGRIQGTISGTDFAFLRPDGVLELNIHAKIDAGNGVLIAVWAGGIGRFRVDEPIIDLAENVRLTTSHESHLWVNGQQVWAIGTVDLVAGTVSIQAFMQRVPDTFS